MCWLGPRNGVMCEEGYLGCRHSLNLGDRRVPGGNLI
jgi:hypothetical protein